MAKRIGKEINNLRRNLAKLTSGQAEVNDVIEPVSDEGPSVLVRLKPNTGYYKGDTIEFKLELHEMYPTDPPTIICISDIYHPNIDTSTMTENNVCLNLLDSEFWSPGFGIQGCVFGLLFLLENPNFDDPICPFFQPRNTLVEYTQDIANHRQGRRVGFMACLLDEVIGCRKSTEEVEFSVQTRVACDSGDNADPKQDLPNEDLGSCIDNLLVNVDKEPGVADEDKKSIADARNVCSLDSRMHNCFESVQNCYGSSDSETKMLSEEIKSKGNQTKRQLSEDNIVHASNKIFQQASGVDICCREITDGDISLDEPVDFEELMYTHFDLDTES